MLLLKRFQQSLELLQQSLWVTKACFPWMYAHVFTSRTSAHRNPRSIDARKQSGMWNIHKTISHLNEFFWQASNLSNRIYISFCITQITIHFHKRLWNPVLKDVVNIWESTECNAHSYYDAYFIFLLNSNTWHGAGVGYIRMKAGFHPVQVTHSSQVHLHSRHHQWEELSVCGGTGVNKKKYNAILRNKNYFQACPVVTSVFGKRLDGKQFSLCKEVC